MKRLFLIMFAQGIVCLAGCKREIAFSPGSPASVISPTPADASVDKNRGDVVVFINNDDRVHKIFLRPGATALPPNPIGRTIYPPGSSATQPSSYTWSIPASATPPTTYIWSCLIHTGEFGTITVNP